MTASPIVRAKHNDPPTREVGAYSGNWSSQPRVCATCEDFERQANGGIDSKQRRKGAVDHLELPRFPAGKAHLGQNPMEVLSFSHSSVPSRVTEPDSRARESGSDRCPIVRNKNFFLSRSPSPSTRVPENPPEFFRAPLQTHRGSDYRDPDTDTERAHRDRAGSGKRAALRVRVTGSDRRDRATRLV